MDLCRSSVEPLEARDQLVGAGPELADRIGESNARLGEPLQTALESPAEIVASLRSMWGEITFDPQLQAVYFGLAAESATDPRLRRTLSYVDDGCRELMQRLVCDLGGRGYRLRMDEASITVLIIAAVQGLTLQYLERGESPELGRAIEDFKRWLSWIAEPAPER